MTDSPPLQEIVDNVRKHARQFQAILDLAACVDSVAKLNQLKSEADAALQKKRADVEEAETKLAAVLARISEANHTANNAAMRAQALEADARGRAGGIILEAQAKAARLERAAEEAAGAVEAQTREASAALEEVQVEIAAADVLLIEKRKEHDAVLARIDEAKARIAKMMGA